MNQNLSSVLTLLMMFLLGCQTHTPQANSAPPKAETTNGTMPVDDSALIEKIRTFSEDVGEQGQRALADMLSLPRNKLIRKLSRLRDNLSQDNSLRPQIAFLFCHLDYEYESNSEVVASALSNSIKYKDFYADQAASLVGRLILRGDVKLLTILFTAVPGSDGALAEELGVIFGNELSNHTERLVAALDEQPKPVRLKVFNLINSTGALTAEEKQQLRHRLRKIKPGSKQYRLAQEILKSVVMNSSE